MFELLSLVRQRSRGIVVHHYSMSGSPISPVVSKSASSPQRYAGLPPINCTSCGPSICGTTRA